MQQGYRYHHNHRIGRQWRKEMDVEHMVIRQIFVLPLEVVFVTYTGWPISNATEVKKIEYLNYGSSKRADFFVHDRGMPKLYIHKDAPRQTLC